MHSLNEFLSSWCIKYVGHNVEGDDILGWQFLFQFRGGDTNNATATTKSGGKKRVAGVGARCSGGGAEA